MKLSLVVTQGSQQGKAIPINKAEFVIGRDAQCQLRPASQHVSKKHCSIRVKGDKVFVEDYGSTNGTFINDQPVKGEREIRDGDRLRIGPLDFQVKVEGGVQAEKPTQVEQDTKVPAGAPKPAPGAKPAAPAKPAAQAKPPSPAKHEAKHDAKNEALPDNLDEDAIGSMLLSMSDEQQGDQPNESDSFASGSTLMQVLKPEEMEQLQNAADSKTPYRPRPSSQGAGANTSQAAKAILEKYRKRPKS
jgi:pSer/pThr/pTyr-binding forkhead associated (FHA) protein